MLCGTERFLKFQVFFSIDARCPSNAFRRRDGVKPQGNSIKTCNTFLLVCVQCCGQSPSQFHIRCLFLLFSRAELGLVTRPTNTGAHTERQPQREIDIRVFGPSSSLLVVVVFLLFVSTVSKFRSTGRLVVPCSVFFPFLFLLAAKKNKEDAGGIRTQQISNCCFFMPCRVHVN